MDFHFQRRRFNVYEYYRMAEVGILDHTERLELINGEIFTRDPITSRSAACTRKLNSILTIRLQEFACVGIQSPVRLDEYSEIEPDIAVLVKRDDFYAEEHPRSKE